MGAGLRFRVAGRVFDLVILQTNRVVDLDLDGTERLPVIGDAVADREVVACVQQDQ